MTVHNINIVAAFTAALLLVACAAIETRDSVTEEDLNVYFAAFGDSGYLPENESDSGLSVVSTDMQQRCASVRCAFAVMLGDNIYPDGADGLPDSAADAWRFQNMFVAPFSPLGQSDEDFRIYATLGNHDWRTSRAGAFVQIGFHEQTPPFYMNGPFYSIRPPSGQGAIEIFVIDTEMLLSEQMIPDLRSIKHDGAVEYGKELERGGSQNARPKMAEEAKQLEWFEQALRSSDAQWKFVVAHHPLWESNGGKHAQAERLRELLMPVLCAYADAYFAGHQHTLEVHENRCSRTDGNLTPLPHFVSGAAAKSRSINERYVERMMAENPQLIHHWAAGDVWGHMIARIDGDQLSIQVFTVPKGGNEMVFSEAFRASFKNRP